MTSHECSFADLLPWEEASLKWWRFPWFWSVSGPWRPPTSTRERPLLKIKVLNQKSRIYSPFNHKRPKIKPPIQQSHIKTINNLFRILSAFYKEQKKPTSLSTQNRNTQTQQKYRQSTNNRRTLYRNNKGKDCSQTHRKTKRKRGNL